MVVKSFYLLGKDLALEHNIHTIEIDITHNIEAAKSYVADSFSIVDPSGVGFQTSDSKSLPDLDAILDNESPIAVTVDGYAVRPPPGPKGLPFLGSYYQIYPDHIGNHHRLFERHGHVLQHTELGRTTYTTDDPAVAAHIFQESAFWSKKIGESHPLFSAKDNDAGLFVADTTTENWRLAHKYLPPALAPKAVRKYTPMTQRAAEESFKVFDFFADNDEAFDVHAYMFKLTSQAVAKLVLNVDLHHFESPDAPLNSLVSDLTEFLSLVKRVQEKGSWYSHLPFGDPKRLREKQVAFSQACRKAIKAAQARGGPDLPIATAALEAESMADYAARAVDENGNKMPEDVMTGSMPVVIGAGFATTSALLSWMMYAIVSHPEVQDKLVQELIDHGVDADTQWNFDTTNELLYLDKFIKETQRLYNPAFQPARTALRDQIIPGGFEIPKDATMVCSLHALHRNPAVWEDPLAFKPDRWDTEKVRKRPAGSFIPFAMGPRSCIGFNFALQEAKTMFATLLYRYEFLQYGEKFIDYDKESIVYRPENMYVQVRRRTNWPTKSE